MELDFIIRFQSPFHMGSGHGRAGLVDRAPLFDGQDVLYLPGSAIKGKIKHAVHRVAATLGRAHVTDCLDFTSLCPSSSDFRFCRGAPCAFCRLFGSPVHPGLYIYEDGKLDGDEAVVNMVQNSGPRFKRAVQMEKRTRVSLERTRRVAKRGHLLMQENGAAFLSFRAKISGPHDPDAEKLLRYGLSCLTHLGGGSAAGLGRLCVEICGPAPADGPSEEVCAAPNGGVEPEEVST